MGTYPFYPGSGGGFANPMTTAGDMIDAGAGGAAQRLPIGSNAQVLTVAAGAPTWENASSGFANPMTTAGDMITGGAGGAAQRLGIGTSSQGLLVVSGAPSWGTVLTALSAGDASITVGGTAAAPTVEAASLDTIAGLHVTAGNIGMAGYKLTSLGYGSNAGDSAAFGQIPTSASAIGGLLAANNLDDVASEATAFANISPLTTKGDLVIENGTPAPARLAVGSVNEVLGVASGLPAWQLGLTLQATTGASGYSLVNGTGTIISWTAPNDGNMHRAVLLYARWVTSAETGGAVQYAYTLPSGNNGVNTVDAGGNGSSMNQESINGYLIEANSTISVNQHSALSAGAATVWAEIWGA